MPENTHELNDNIINIGLIKNDKICTIYLLTNTVNGKIYIGQTWMTLERRMGIDGGRYENSIYLYNAIKKYGSDKFKYTVLATCNTQEKANELEKKYIEEYDSRNNEIGYNIKEGGSNGKHSEETKEKISKNACRYWKDKELPQDIKDKISKTKLDLHLKHTDEWKENNSKFMIERHKQMGHPMQGKHHTEESRLKISKTNTGQIFSKETIEQRSKKLEIEQKIQNQIIKLYHEGESITNIQNILNLYTSAIYRVLKRHNITPRFDSKIKKERTKTILKLTSEGKSIEEIMTLLNVSSSTVVRARRDGDIPEPVDSEDKINNIIELLESKTDKEVICEKLNVSSRFVTLIIKRNSAEEKERIRLMKERDEKIFALYKEIRDKEFVAKTMNVSTSIVGRVLREFDWNSSS